MRWDVPLTVCVVFFACLPMPARATEPRQCLDLHASHARAKLSGELTVQIFAWLPEFSQRNQPEYNEPALILKLPRPICANDAMFIDGSADFDTVDVRSELPRILKILNASIGRHVSLRGEAFGAYLAHHKAPLVLYADQVVVR